MHHKPKTERDLQGASTINPQRSLAEFIKIFLTFKGPMSALADLNYSMEAGQC
jgi:hypothetical protein